MPMYMRASARSRLCVSGPVTWRTHGRLARIVAHHYNGVCYSYILGCLIIDSSPSALPTFPPVTALGLLPPPSCLCSVPLFTAHLPGPAFSSPPQPTMVSWAGSDPTGGTPGLPTWQQQATGTISHSPQPGLVLSPAAAPFPKKLVDRIQAGNFLEMKELLTDNMELISQIEAVQGLPPAHMPGIPRPRLREVSSLTTWCYCFLGYVAIRSSDPTTRNQLAYARLLIKEAQRHGGLGWLDYDRAFRQQAASDPSLPWNTLSPGLQASTMFCQQPTDQRSFCTLCREVDHTRAQCALACLQPPAASTPAVPRTSQPPPTRRRPETALRICISWNMGACVFQGQCTYRHVCATCQLPPQHRARDCPKTPDSSSYKRRLGAPRQGPQASASASS